MDPKFLRTRMGCACVMVCLVVSGFFTSCKKDESVPADSATKITPNFTTTSLAATAVTGATGTILREEWDNVAGNDVVDIPVTTTPTSSSQITALEGPQNHGSNYGDRMRGYIYAPTTGNYTFWIAGDDAGELWLSTDDNPANKVKIASVLSWTNFRQFTEYASQKSVSIPLVAGKRYYVEVLHKQGGGGDNISVQWELPGSTYETPIPGTRLSPYIPVVSGATGSILREEWDNVTGNDVVDIPVTTTPTSSKQITTMEGVQNQGSNYGDRIRGYIYPPTTGSYTFWIAADDAGEVWLSTDDNPANKVKIASTLSWTNFREFTKFASQKSAAVTLQANQKYYIEVLHKQGAGGDDLSVQWQMPGNAIETPIPGSRLSPYVATATTAATAAVATTSAYTPASVISLTGASNQTISGKSIIGGTVPAITLINCNNIHITNSKLYNSTDVGIHLINCTNITVDYCYFTNVSSGVYAEQTTAGGIIVNNNQFLNMVGPFPRGQFVQFNNVSGPNCSISNNKGENIFGQSYAEDAINLYQSHGTAASPIMINANWIRGGGPSASGGGIMLGDNGGSYLTATNNILVNPGEYGMAIAGGDHNVISNNSVYGAMQYFTNVGIYVDNIGGYAVTNATVSGNLVNFYNSTNYNNNSWLAPGVNAPSGWNNGNTWGANISTSLLPATIITYK